jgi:NurA-like 5'-3' nuclease
MNKTQLKLIEKLEEVTCSYDRSCQECLEEVECVIGWFDVNDEEKKEIVEYFKNEHNDYKWVSKMIKNVFTYISYNSEFAS